MAYIYMMHHVATAGLVIKPGHSCREPPAQICLKLSQYLCRTWKTRAATIDYFTNWVLYQLVQRLHWFSLLKHNGKYTTERFKVTLLFFNGKGTMPQVNSEINVMKMRSELGRGEPVRSEVGLWCSHLPIPETFLSRRYFTFMQMLMLVRGLDGNWRFVVEMLQPCCCTVTVLCWLSSCSEIKFRF